MKKKVGNFEYRHDENSDSYVGKGQYALVFKGNHIHRKDEIVAIKVNFIGKLKQKELQYLESVCQILTCFVV
jgi:hypothetical protein